jgi:hypothetical protein
MPPKRKSTAEAAEKSPASSSVDASSPPSPNSSAPIPLEERSVDALLALWFVLFAFSTSFTDLHNFTASVRGVEVSALRGASLTWPPPALTELYFRWAETVDPLLYQNPVWWQCIEWVNMLCLTPFALVAPFAFWRGAAWVRMPAVVVSAFTLYSLILCIGTTLCVGVVALGGGEGAGLECAASPRALARLDPSDLSRPAPSRPPRARAATARCAPPTRRPLRASTSST